MSVETVTLDPTSEDAANTELAVTPANGYEIVEHHWPIPGEEVLWASSVDTEGERPAGRRPQNRTGSLKLLIGGATESAYRAARRNLAMKLGKLRAEGGTYKITLANGDVIVFDILRVDGDEELFSTRLDPQRLTSGTLTFTALPYGRGSAQAFSTETESTLPVLRLEAAGVKGDVHALGELLIDELQGQDQFWLHWGIRSRHYSNDADNALFYEAEGRTPLGGATVVTGTAPASGGASNNVVRQATLTPAWQAMLSTQASGGGNHLEHIGVYEVWARVLIPLNTGEVSIRLDWAEGDFRRFTSNPEVTFEVFHSRAGQWLLVNLGQVFLHKAAQGAQRWEGKVVAKSTVPGDDLDVDCLWLRPIEEGNGTARGLLLPGAPNSFSARDEFNQTAGVLAGKTLPVGGTWSGAGDADDFSVETTGKTAQRTAVSDAANTGRQAIAGTTAFTTTAVQLDTKAGAVSNGQSAARGPIARWVDANNFLEVVLTTDSFFGTLIQIRKRIAGTFTTLQSAGNLFSALPHGKFFGLGEWVTIDLVVSGDRYFVWLYRQGAAPGVPILVGQDPDLAGTLASGRVGIIDRWEGGLALTRNYDNFAAWVPTLDAAVFANQSLELRHDRAIREDSGGTVWAPVSDYEGDYLLVPPAGMEGRTTEILAKTSRNDPDWGSDSAIDDIRGTLTVTPRYLKIPEP